MNPRVDSSPSVGLGFYHPQKRNGNVWDMQKILNTNLLSEWTQQETKWNNLSVSPGIGIQGFISSFHTLYSQMQVDRKLAGVMIPLDLKESIHYVKLKKKKLHHFPTFQWNLNRKEQVKWDKQFINPFHHRPPITLSLRSFNKQKLIFRPTSCWHIDRLLNYRVFGLENNDWLL